MITKETVKNVIDKIDTYTDDELVHMYKCASSVQDSKSKPLVKPLISIIEKERRKRGTAKTISSKITGINETKKTTNGVNPDDY